MILRVKNEILTTLMVTVTKNINCKLDFNEPKKLVKDEKNYRPIKVQLT